MHYRLISSNFDIFIHIDDTNTGIHHSYHSLVNEEKSSSIHLLYKGRNHYDLLKQSTLAATTTRMSKSWYSVNKECSHPSKLSVYFFTQRFEEDLNPNQFSYLNTEKGKGLVKEYVNLLLKWTNKHTKLPGFGTVLFDLCP